MRPSRWAMACASGRLAAPSLPRMLDTCTLAVLGAMNSTEAISLLLRPAVMSRSTSRSLAVSEARTAPSPRCSAVPILARRARSSRALRSGLAFSLSAVRAAWSHWSAASSRRPAFRLPPRGGPWAPRPPPLPRAPRLGERLGQPPPGPGDLVDIRGPELLQHRLPRLRVVLAAGPAVLRRGPGQPAASLRAEDELGPPGEGRALAGNLPQLIRRGQLGCGRAVVARGAGQHGP